MIDVTTISSYYHKTFVQFEILKSLQNRYMSARIFREIDKPPMVKRYYAAYTIKLLQWSFDNIALYKYPAKLYYDLTTWNKEAPFFSPKSEVRNEQKIEFTINEGWKYLAEGFDFAMDFDAENIMTAHKEAAKVKSVFDELQLPYSVKNSGSKGFHLWIPTQFFPKSLNVLERPQEFKRLAEMIGYDFGLETIDSSVYLPTQILKLPYSLDWNKEGQISVVLPLDDKQFSGFSPETVRLENVMKNVHIMGRGLLLRTHGLPSGQLQTNTEKFLTRFS